MIEIFIAIATLIIVVIIGMMDFVFRRPAMVNGAAENNQSGVKELAEALTIKMDPAAAKMYQEEFIESFNGPKQPPVVTLQDIGHGLPYSQNTAVFKPTVHIGQRKLHLSEVQFFADHVPADEAAICVYAGAAPSNHTGMLSRMFPNIKFLLVDPNPFDVRGADPVFLVSNKPDVQAAADDMVEQMSAGEEAIYIINGYFTNEIAKSCSKLKNVFFISDIRTNLEEVEREPGSIDILWNLSQQYNWITIMKPRKSMLKFRHPFYQESIEEFMKYAAREPCAADYKMSREFGIDFIENRKSRRLKYFDGIINIQAFPGQSSTETRLITDGRNVIDYGDPSDYENKLFRYNNLLRVYVLHKNDNADPALGFDHCNDCAIENHIWSSYLEKYKGKYPADTTVKSLVAEISKITYRDLRRGAHGKYFKQFPIKPLLKAAETYAAKSIMCDPYTGEPLAASSQYKSRFPKKKDDKAED